VEKKGRTLKMSTEQNSAKQKKKSTGEGVQTVGRQRDFLSAKSRKTGSSLNRKKKGWSAAKKRSKPRGGNPMALKALSQGSDTTTKRRGEKRKGPSRSVHRRRK